jgi:hypothetical protein
VGQTDMIWRVATAVLLGNFIAISAWIYLRDRSTAAPPPSGRNQAQSDGRRVLDALAQSSDCAGGQCVVDVLDMVAAQTWRVKVTSRSWQRCFDIHLDSFGASREHGLTGLRSAPCRPVG